MRGPVQFLHALAFAQVGMPRMASCLSAKFGQQPPRAEHTIGSRYRSRIADWPRTTRCLSIQGIEPACKWCFPGKGPRANRDLRLRLQLARKPPWPSDRMEKKMEPKSLSAFLAITRL